jgi:hypothetical protein
MNLELDFAPPRKLAELKPRWVEDAASQMALLLPGLGEFTSDDLHALIASPQSPNWWGVLLAKLANEGLLRRVGVRPSRRPEANGRLVSVWAWNHHRTNPAAA